MAKEIERKFLVREGIRESDIAEMSEGSKSIRQYYLVSSRDAAVRIRHQDDAAGAVLTIKSGGDGISTDEFEFPVAASCYDDHIRDRKGVEIVKKRYLVPHGGRTWEVDVFRGDLEGLVVAELECDDAAEVTDLPDWVGEEVTYDSRYKNAVLALRGKPQGNVRDTLQGLAARVANNRAVMRHHPVQPHRSRPEGRQVRAPALQHLGADRDLGADALAKLYDHPSEPNKVSGSDGIDETVVDYMTGTDETATHELRTLNPFAKNIITIEDPPEYLVEGFELQPYSHPVPNAERQKAFEDAMSQVVRADPDQIMRADPPFDIFERPIDGLTEGLMFAPGDAVFTEVKASDESTVEGNGSVPEEGVLLHVANSGHVVTVSPHAAGVADAYSGISDDLATKFMSAAESHRYIDQSQEFILIGEVTDEASADLIKRAVAEGHETYTRKED